jgi:hypothetical protein
MAGRTFHSFACVCVCVCVWVEGSIEAGGCRFGITPKLPCSKSNHLCEILLV